MRPVLENIAGKLLTIAAILKTTSEAFDKELLQDGSMSVEPRGNGGCLRKSLDPISGDAPNAADPLN